MSFAGAEGLEMTELGDLRVLVIDGFDRVSGEIKDLSVDVAGFGEKARAIAREEIDRKDEIEDGAKKKSRLSKDTLIKVAIGVGSMIITLATAAFASGSLP